MLFASFVVLRVDRYHQKLYVWAIAAKGTRQHRASEFLVLFESSY